MNEILVDLPEPSGAVKFRGELTNSLGGHGAYYVGQNEFEQPDEDVQFAKQLLADALLAQQYHREHYWDVLAQNARVAWLGNESEADDVPAEPWQQIDRDRKDRWRAVARAVIAANDEHDGRR